MQDEQGGAVASKSNGGRKSHEQPTQGDNNPERVIEAGEVPMISSAVSTDTGDGLEALHDFESAAVDLSLPFTPISTLKTEADNKDQKKAVNPRRKEELLLEARADRMQWIQQAPLPYRKEGRSNDPWKQGNSLRLISSSHAVSQVPSAIPALEQLYGIQTSAKESVDAIDGRLKSLMDSSWKDKAIPKGLEILEQEMDLHEDDPSLVAYNSFLLHLQNPACAVLVQGMRRFCRNILKVSESEALAKMIQAYLDSTFSSIRSNVAWKNEDIEQLQVRRSLESCVYAHCNLHIQSVLWTAKVQAEEDEWLKKLDSLQFVTPSHLEISCLEEEVVSGIDENGRNDLTTLLKAPIDALLAVDMYYSPYEKLERVLAMYRGVNAALSEALNRHKSSNDGISYRKLPSADDVLPTMIIVLLKTKPRHLLLNLQIMEDWSPPEYIRGEAGYAYTNLYGAVQFLRDLDLDNEPKNLRIDHDELRKAIETTREAAANKLSTETNLPESSLVSSEVYDSPHLRASQIREARQNGIKIDVDWATEIIDTENSKEANEGLAKSDTNTSLSAFDEAVQDLPPNFNRHYSFLTSTPEDVTLSDVPDLLDEYRILVHTVERLIGNKAAQIKASKKAAVAATEKDLFARVKELDPSLLPHDGKARKTSF